MRGHQEDGRKGAPAGGKANRGTKAAPKRTRKKV
jgi:hypothetical protein